MEVFASALLAKNDDGDASIVDGGENTAIGAEVWIEKKLYNMKAMTMF